MIWPWQYKNKVKEYEARINELKSAGWYAVNGWYSAVGYLKNDQYIEMSKKYKWEKAYRVFFKDKEIDGSKVDLLTFYYEDNSL